MIFIHVYDLKDYGDSSMLSHATPAHGFLLREGHVVLHHAVHLYAHLLVYLFLDEAGVHDQCHQECHYHEDQDHQDCSPEVLGFVFTECLLPVALQKGGALLWWFLQ